MLNRYTKPTTLCMTGYVDGVLRMDSLSIELVRVFRTQQPEWGATMKQHAKGHSIHPQPENVCTAGEVFLLSTYILARYPQMTVVILPSDHFVSVEHLVLTTNRAVQDRGNTLGLAAKGKELRSWGCFPELMSQAEGRNKRIDTAKDLRVVDATHEALSHPNFSSPLLHFAPEGVPERTTDTLDKIDRPMACAKEPMPFLYQG